MPTPHDVHTADLTALDTLTTSMDRCQLVLMDVRQALDQIRRAQAEAYERWVQHMQAGGATVERPCASALQPTPHALVVFCATGGAQQELLATLTQAGYDAWELEVDTQQTRLQRLREEDGYSA